MKQCLLFLIIFLFLPVSCEMATMDNPSECEVGELFLEISISEDTKAITTLNYERDVRNIQFLVFDEKEDLVHYVSTKQPVTCKLGVGNYRVWAIVNGPDYSGVKFLSELSSKIIMLGDNSTTRGFVMRGFGSIPVVAETTRTLKIVVERLVSRIYINNITNNCSDKYGDIVLKGVFLANVVGDQKLGGVSTPSVWYNKCGCVGPGNNQIDGSNFIAEIPDMTYRSINKTISVGQTENIGACVYGFQNTETTISEEFPFTPRMSRLCFILVQKDPLTGELVEHHKYCDLTHFMLTNTTYSFDLAVDGNIGKEVAITVTANLVNGYDTVEGGSFDI